jgi:hypothetical protein
MGEAKKLRPATRIPSALLAPVRRRKAPAGGTRCVAWLGAAGLEASLAAKPADKERSGTCPKTRRLLHAKMHLGGAEPPLVLFLGPPRALASPVPSSLLRVAALPKGAVGRQITCVPVPGSVSGRTWPGMLRCSSPRLSRAHTCRRCNGRTVLLGRELAEWSS